MFALRGVAVSFSVFFLVYGTLSIAVLLTWRRLRHWMKAHPAYRIADGLFLLRMLPLIAAAVITAAFTIPSFVLLEPRVINEPLGDVPLMLGLCGAAFGLYGLVNAARALVHASSAVTSWTRGAEPMPAFSQRPVLRIRRAVPAMTATGIIRPKILVSASAEFVLSNRELHSALSHELAHVRRWDNLKKLLLRFAVFPGTLALDAGWLEATEMAADDAAVSNSAEALDLAAALIKLSRFAPAQKSDGLTAALVHSPAAVINARVERLIDWKADRQLPEPRLAFAYGLTAASVVVLSLAFSYIHVLIDVHAVTEWLMR